MPSCGRGARQAEDARAEIYYDVRTAFLDLKATEEELETATRARGLASQQLTQSRDRFAAGVTSNIEVVQSQEAVAQASEQYIAALVRLQRRQGDARAIARNGRGGRGQVPRRLGNEMTMRVRILVGVAVAGCHRRRRLVVDRGRARVHRRCPGGCAHHADRRSCGRNACSECPSKPIRRSRLATVLVEIDKRDYEVALERARAELADAEAAAKAAQAGVPITSTTASSNELTARGGVEQAEVAYLEAPAGRRSGENAAARRRRRDNARLRPTQPKRAGTSSGSSRCSTRTRSRSSSTTRQWQPPLPTWRRPIPPRHK